jgi:hypothetical protein
VKAGRTRPAADFLEDLSGSTAFRVEISPQNKSRICDLPSRTGTFALVVTQWIAVSLSRMECDIADAPSFSTYYFDMPHRSYEEVGE